MPQKGDESGFINFEFIFFMGYGPNLGTEDIHHLLPRVH